jgi:hypothetical protein
LKSIYTIFSILPLGKKPGKKSIDKFQKSGIFKAVVNKGLEGLGAARKV